MANPKRSLGEERLVGVRPREQRDLFGGCNEPGQPWFHPDANAFMKAFCRVCRNVDCIRAKGAISPWLTRMREQVDYLLNDPQFSDLSSPEHQAITQMAFEQMNAKAERLEIAARRQDWEIPDVPSDGVATVAAPDATTAVDEAVKELARAKGRPEPDLPRPRSESTPTHFREVTEVEYETQYPSSSEPNKSYRVALTKSGEWSCECQGFRHIHRCKHLETVRSWYEDQLRMIAEEETKQRETAASIAPPPSVEQQPHSQPFNTPMPPEGVMVGGEPLPPATARARLPVREAIDPWAPRKDIVVEPGGTVTLRRRKP